MGSLPAGGGLAMTASAGYSGPNDFTQLVEMQFDLDEEDLDRGTNEIFDDESLRILRRENRVALARGTPVRLENISLASDQQAVDVPLLFLLHAHPECTFDWARLVVDLTPTPNARIADMSPREVEDVPVDIETKVGVGLKFSVIGTPVNIQAAPEVS